MITRTLAPLSTALLILAFCGASPASAATIYDESVDGDITDSTSLPLPPIAVLSVGTNIVLGSIGIGDSADNFNVTVPVGLQITGVTGQIFNNGLVSAGTWIAASGGALGSALIPPGVDYLFVPALDYPFTDPQLFSLEGDGGGFDYVWTITAESVPEPSVWIPLAIGLVGLSRSCKRRSNPCA